jgi:hypothetical protein
MQRAVDLMARAHMEVASDIPLGLETAYRVRRHLHIPVDPLEIIRVSDTAVPDLLAALHDAGFGDRHLPEHVWRHGAYAGLVAAQYRYEVLANSGLPVAFDASNATYAASPGAQGSSVVLNAADITARLATSLKLARLQHNMSQDILAERLRRRGRIHPRRNEIIRWEKGRVRISEDALLSLMAVLGHDLCWWYADHEAELEEFESRLALV